MSQAGQTQGTTFLQRTPTIVFFAICLITAVCAAAVCFILTAVLLVALRIENNAVWAVLLLSSVALGAFGSIAFMRQFLLVKLGFDGHGDLSGYKFCEFEIESIIGACRLAPEGHDAQSLVRGSQRQAANGRHRMVDDSLRNRKAVFQIEIANDDGFLILPDPARD